MWRKFCGWLLKAMGWTVESDPPEDPKCILLGVPHTSMWDFIIAYLYYQSVGGKALCMVKESLFFPPLGWILRAMGGIPVDQKHPGALVRSILKEMEKRERFHLAIAPEGTRSPVKRWKTGFHYIARKTGIPVYLGYFDWGTKRVGRGERVDLTDDAAADLERIQQLYEDMHLTGKHPEKYITH